MTILMKLLTLMGLFIFGAVMGSFACCQAWRLRLAEKGKKDPGKWSVCLSCKHRLAWYDNIPLLSWLSLRGKCRYCKASIGGAEILSEVGLGTVFVLMGAYYMGILRSGCGLLNYACGRFDLSSEVWNFDPVILLDLLMAAVLAVILVGMWIIFIYDAKWQLMPAKILTLVNVSALVYVILKHVSLFMLASDTLSTSEILTTIIWPSAFSTIISVVLTAGFYYLLYLLSHETLVGGGDWILCIAIGLLLGNWWLAVIMLCVANFAACEIAMFRNIYMAEIKRKAPRKRIAFGPFLISGFVVAFIIQDWLLSLLTLAM